MSIWKLMMVAALIAATMPHLAKRDLFPVFALIAASVPFLAVPGLSDRYPFPIEANSPLIGGALMAVAAYVLLHWCRDFWQIIAAFVLCVGIFISAFAAMPIGLDRFVHAIVLECVFYAIMLSGGASAFLGIDDFPPPISRGAHSLMEALARWNGSA